MSKKVFQPPRLAPLQRVVAEPITDPAEKAALDKAHKEQKRRQRGRKTTRNRKGANAASNAATKKKA